MSVKAQPGPLHPDENPDLFIKEKKPIIVVVALILGTIALLFSSWFWLFFAPSQEDTTCDEGYTEMYLIEYKAPSEKEPLPRVEVAQHEDRRWYKTTFSFMSEVQLQDIEKRFSTLCVRPLSDSSDMAVLRPVYE